MTDKNKEIQAVLAMVSDSTQNLEPKVIDSLDKVVSKMKKLVDEKHTLFQKLEIDDNLLEEKFADFDVDCEKTVDRITILKTLPENNWLLYIGIGLGVLMVGSMLFMQIWNPIKAKRQQRRMMKEQEKMAERERLRIFLENSDDLDEI